jgi:hypothetical protein
VHKFAPRGIYTCDRGIYGVGLNDYVSKDPKTSVTVCLMTFTCIIEYFNDWKWNYDMSLFIPLKLWIMDLFFNVIGIGRWSTSFEW